MGSRYPLELASQHLHDLPDRLLIPAIPAPLAFLAGLDESGFSKNRHVMRDGGLRKADPRFDFPSAETRRLATLFCLPYLGRAFFQHLENTAPGRIGNSVQSSVE